MGVPGPPQPCWTPSPALLQPWRCFALYRDFFFVDGESRFPRNGLPSAEGCGNTGGMCRANCLKTRPYGDDKSDQANLGFGS